MTLLALRLPELTRQAAASPAASRRGRAARGSDASLDAATLAGHALSTLSVGEAATLAPPLLATLLARPGRLRWALEAGLCAAAGGPSEGARWLTPAGHAARDQLSALDPRLGAALLDFTRLGAVMRTVPTTDAAEVHLRLGHMAADRLKRTLARLTFDPPPPPPLLLDPLACSAREQLRRVAAYRREQQHRQEKVGGLAGALASWHAELRRVTPRGDHVTSAVRRAREDCQRQHIPRGAAVLGPTLRQRPPGQLDGPVVRGDDRA